MIRRFSHSIQALIIFGLFVSMGTRPLASALAGILPLMYREVSQAEYRWIVPNGGLRAKMPWWEGWNVFVWTMHSIRDVAVPALVVVVPALALMVLR